MYNETTIVRHPRDWLNPLNAGGKEGNENDVHPDCRPHEHPKRNGCPVSPVGPEAFRRWLRRNSFSAQLATAHLSGFVAKGLIGEFVTCGQFVTREPGGEETAPFPCRRRFRRRRGKVPRSRNPSSTAPGW